jgi:hypothetical protein
MATLQMDTNLQESKVNCLNNAMSDRAIIINGPFRKALMAQAQIRCLAMLQGYWSKEWQKAYEHSYQAPPSKRRKERNRRQLQMG